MTSEMVIPALNDLISALNDLISALNELQEAHSGSKMAIL
jgi:hypothetical protein